PSSTKKRNLPITSAAVPPSSFKEPAGEVADGGADHGHHRRIHHVRPVEAAPHRNEGAAQRSGLHVIQRLHGPPPFLRAATPALRPPPARSPGFPAPALRTSARPASCRAVSPVRAAPPALHHAPSGLSSSS